MLSLGSLHIALITPPSLLLVSLNHLNTQYLGQFFLFSVYIYSLGNLTYSHIFSNHLYLDHSKMYIANPDFVPEFQALT